MVTHPRRRRIATSSGDEGFTLVELVGDRDGPTLSIVGGVHGDEFEGVAACLGLADGLDRAMIRGRLRLVAVAHEAAHIASLRSSPIDGRNLARTFPGDPAGAPTERLAAALVEHLIAGSDAFVDLHSAGTAYAMPLLVGWGDDGCPTCVRSTAAAEAFAAPVLWRHAGPLPPGRTLSAAHDAGIPSIYAEASGGGSLNRPEAAAYEAGVRRVMASLGMIDHAPHDALGSDWRPLRLVGEGDLDVPAIVAPFDGLCEMLVGPLDRVAEGQPVAIVTDPPSGERAEVRSAASGVVVLARRGARVARDENLVVLAQPVAENA
jgi:N2-acetyl-L-2,4-diaminobutanoate deacetylase